MNKYTLTLFEACEYLNRSKKTLTRYIRQGKLHPQRAKSKQGTLEYRFTKEDLNAFKESLEKPETETTSQKAPKPHQKALKTLKAGKDETRQGRQDTPRPEGQGQYNRIITILNDTAEMLKHQLTIKDKQIETLNTQMHQLIERDRETNILLKGLQDKLLLLPEQTGQDRTDKHKSRGDKIKQIILLSLIAVLTAIIIYQFR